MKIVLLESLAVTDAVVDKYAETLQKAGHTLYSYTKNIDEALLIKRVKDAGVIIIANMPLSAKVIESCERLKFIDVAFTGVDHVALEAAKAKGVAVSNASGYATEAVAELVIGLAISLLRNVPQVDKRCREGGVKDGLVGSLIRGKTVGIVGCGAIGLRTAELFSAFGCDIIAHEPAPKADTPDYIRFAPLSELLTLSDIVTLHCPLLDSTRGLINKDTLAVMKPSAILINAARGPVVDSEALAEALNSGRIAGAGIDVFETEPPLPAGHPLLRSKNTIVTPHIAFASKESMELRAEIVFSNLFAWLNDKQSNKIL
ncbi:MAG: hydroxyacid dehydrogenase [Clostridiales bacterium]|jgi:D-3-phosphoglycerate dehydrogenase|nr:hydroxyacid dehydrogenase [Clostridiales bacterium]